MPGADSLATPRKSTTPTSNTSLRARTRPGLSLGRCHSEIRSSQTSRKRELPLPKTPLARMTGREHERPQDRSSPHGAVWARAAYNQSARPIHFRVHEQWHYQRSKFRFCLLRRPRRSLDSGRRFALPDWGKRWHWRVGPAPNCRHHHTGKLPLRNQRCKQHHQWLLNRYCHGSLDTCSRLAVRHGGIQRSEHFIGGDSRWSIPVRRECCLRAEQYHIGVQHRVEWSAYAYPRFSFPRFSPSVVLSFGLPKFLHEGDARPQIPGRCSKGGWPGDVQHRVERRGHNRLWLAVLCLKRVSRGSRGPGCELRIEPALCSHSHLWPGRSK